MGFTNFGFRRVMEEAGEGDAGGGAGGFGDGGAAEGGAGDEGGAGEGDLGAEGGGLEDGIVVPEWAKSYELEQDIAGDPSLKPIGDVQSLIKSYVHAQRKIGQKGAILPTETSSKEEWDTFYQKTGVPLEEKDYVERLEFPTTEEGSQFNEEFNGDFAKMAHELRVRPDQAVGLYKFFNDQAKTTSERYMTDTNEKTQEGLDNLLNELGPDAYNARLSKATQMLTDNVGPEFVDYLKDSGLGRNAEVVKALGLIADKFYKEETIPKGQASSSLSKDQAQQEINNAMSNPNDPYLMPTHADHKRRVNEINKFFAIVG